MTRRVVALLAVVGLPLACSPPGMPIVTVDEATPDTFVFRDVSVFDGETMLRHQDVHVRGERIELVQDTGITPTPRGALELSGSGRTLLPGLVDSHAHFFSAGEKKGPPPEPEAIAQAFLFAGVTTVLVAAGFDDTTGLMRSGTLAPHLFYAGPGLTAPAGHPVPLLRAMLPWPARVFAIRAIPTAANADEARAAVRSIAHELEPPFFKIIHDDLPPGSPHLSLEALRAAVAEARDLGMRPIVHSTLPVDAVVAAEAGASLLVHVPQRGALEAGDVERLRATGVPVVSTVRMITASHELASDGPSALESAMYGSKLLAPWIDEPAWALPGFSEEIDARWEEAAEITRENFRRLHAAGVPLFVGTDSGVHGVFPGSSLHQEIARLVELGVPPIDVLRAATSAPAAFLDPNEAFGRIAPGHRADLLLVRGDPSEDISAISSIEEVFLAGARLRREGAAGPTVGVESRRGESTR